MDDDEREKEAQAAIHYYAGKLSESMAAEKGMEVTPQFIHGLASVIYKQIQVMGNDATLFAKHAKRQQVNADDVLLLARRNGELQERLKECLADGREAKDPKRRKKD
ncbi:kinetochore component CENP-S-domain-containing protein [Chytridium lagenaria]|nr:kinetochore component CENP-S-domain-containing protein [Chytridium lagenaria]